MAYFVSMIMNLAMVTEFSESRIELLGDMVLFSFVRGPITMKKSGLYEISGAFMHY